MTVPSACHPGLADPGSSSPGEHRQQRGLAAAVDPDDPDPVPGAEPPGHLVKEGTLAVVGADRHRNVLQLDHGLAQPGGGQPGQLDAVAGRRLGRDERVGRLDPELRLGGPGPGAPLQPGELLTGQVAAAPFGGVLAALTFGLREHVGRVAALGGVHLAPVDLPGPLADGVEQPAVVADHDDRAVLIPGPVAQVPAEPVDRLDVEVVGGLVEQQHVLLGHQQGGERDPAPLAAGQLLGLSVDADPGQQLGHDRARPGIRLPRCPRDIGSVRLRGGSGHSQADRGAARSAAHGPEHDLADRTGQLVGLRQVADPQAGRHGHPAGVRRDPPGQHPEQRGLPRAVAAYHPDPVPGRHAERNAVEQAAVRVRLGRLLQADQVYHVRVTSTGGRWPRLPLGR